MSVIILIVSSVWCCHTSISLHLNPEMFRSLRSYFWLFGNWHMCWIMSCSSVEPWTDILLIAMHILHVLCSMSFFPIFAFQGISIVYISNWYLPWNKLELILADTLILLSNIQPLWSSITLSSKKITKYEVTVALEMMHYLAGWSCWKSSLSPPLP